MAFFQLRIDMDNDAFREGEHAGEQYAYVTELRRLLKLVEEQACDETLIYADLRDSNGNRVGAWAISDRTDLSHKQF